MWHLFVGNINLKLGPVLEIEISIESSIKFSKLPVKQIQKQSGIGILYEES